MSETLKANTSVPTTQEKEIEEVIKGLEQYRERIINETLEQAKKVKILKGRPPTKERGAPHPKNP